MYEMMTSPAMMLVEEEEWGRAESRHVEVNVVILDGTPDYLWTVHVAIIMNGVDLWYVLQRSVLSRGRVLPQVGRAVFSCECARNYCHGFYLIDVKCVFGFST